jgi:divalent metal cation (Fe/Co/Zn/Cd) transporter
MADIVASALAYVGVRAASAPPDERHPYGHGKIETLAGFGESILLFLMVLYLIGEGIHRLLQGVVLESLEVGLAVMSLSTLTSLLIGQYVTPEVAGGAAHALAGVAFERAAPDGRFLDQCGRPAPPFCSFD